MLELALIHLKFWGKSELQRVSGIGTRLHTQCIDDGGRCQINFAAEFVSRYQFDYGTEFRRAIAELCKGDAHPKRLSFLERLKRTHI